MNTEIDWETENQQARQAQANGENDLSRPSFFKWFEHKPDPSFWSPTANSRQRQSQPIKSPSRLQPPTSIPTIPQTQIQQPKQQPTSTRTHSTGITSQQPTGQNVRPRPSVGMKPPTAPSSISTTTTTTTTTSHTPKHGSVRRTNSAKTPAATSVLPIPLPTASKPKRTPQTTTIGSSNPAIGITTSATKRQQTPGRATLSVTSSSQTPGTAHLVELVNTLERRVDSLQAQLAEEKLARLDLEKQLIQIRGQVSLISQ